MNLGGARGALQVENDSASQAADAGAGKSASLEALDEAWIASLSPRKQSLLNFILAQETIRAALARDLVVELGASEDADRNKLLPNSARVEVDSAKAAEALSAVRRLRDGVSAILVHNALQFLTETRQFLGLCFSKLSVGGVMIVTVPHQFLYERKLRLPSRRNSLHRRFYTPNTLLADIEEAIDPCECRVRFVGENDAEYNYRAKLDGDPGGGQDIVVALERISRPAWRPELDLDEHWARAPDKPSRFPALNPNEPALTGTVKPAPHEIRRIILVKLDHRGDFIMASEAFRTFREAFPKAEITLVCGPWNVAEANASGYFDKILPFDFFPEDDSARTVKPPREALIAGFAKEIEKQSYDLAVDLRLFDDTRPVLQAIKAADRAGFDRHDSFPWLTVRLAALSETEDTRPEESVIPASRFNASIGRHRTFEIRSETPGPLAGPERALIWGAYQDLVPGRYRFECLIEPLADDFEIAIDIVADFGKRRLAAGKFPVTAKSYPSLQLRVPEKTEKSELRLRGGATSPLGPFRFLGVRVVRAGLGKGLHQREAMTLLAHLVRLRLTDPYSIEVG